jgi:hypothetical protein
MNRAAISQAIAILFRFLTVAGHAADGMGESTIRNFKPKYWA